LPNLKILKKLIKLKLEAKEEIREDKNFKEYFDENDFQNL